MHDRRKSTNPTVCIYERERERGGGYGLENVADVILVKQT